MSTLTNAFCDRQNNPTANDEGVPHDLEKEQAYHQERQSEEHTQDASTGVPAPEVANRHRCEPYRESHYGKARYTICDSVFTEIHATTRSHVTCLLDSLYKNLMDAKSCCIEPSPQASGITRNSCHT